MSEVHVKDGESLENALKRFKRSCAKSGVLAEVRKREHYESPSVKRRKKSEAARKNRKKYYESYRLQDPAPMARGPVVSVPILPEYPPADPQFVDRTAPPAGCPVPGPPAIFCGWTRRRQRERNERRSPGTYK